MEQRNRSRLRFETFSTRTINHNMLHIHFPLDYTLPCTDSFRLPTRSGRCPLVVMGSTGNVRQAFLQWSCSPSSPFSVVSSLIVSVVMVMLVCLMSGKGDGGGSGLNGTEDCRGRSRSCSSGITLDARDACDRRRSSGVLGVRGVFGVFGGSPREAESRRSGSVIWMVAVVAVGDGVCVFDEGERFGGSMVDGFCVWVVCVKEEIEVAINLKFLIRFGIIHFSWYSFALVYHTQLYITHSHYS